VRRLLLRTNWIRTRCLTAIGGIDAWLIRREPDSKKPPKVFPGSRWMQRINLPKLARVPSVVLSDLINRHTRWV
jgi:hypothetical protein